MARKANATVRRQNKLESTYKKKDGIDIKPVYYYGKLVGNGAYFAGQLNNQLICDNNGIPIPYKSIVGDKKDEKRI